MNKLRNYKLYVSRNTAMINASEHLFLHMIGSTINWVGSINVREDGAPVGIEAILEIVHFRSFNDV